MLLDVPRSTVWAAVSGVQQSTAANETGVKFSPFLDIHPLRDMLCILAVEKPCITISAIIPKLETHLVHTQPATCHSS